MNSTGSSSSSSKTKNSNKQITTLTSSAQVVGADYGRNDFVHEVGITSRSV